VGDVEPAPANAREARELQIQARDEDGNYGRNEKDLKIGAGIDVSGRSPR
jgi:hypothetical protein